jgi:hypothetical protein
MVTPADVSYSVASGAVVRGGRAGRPAWRMSIAANTIGVIPSSNLLSDLNPKFNPAINPVYPASPNWYYSNHSNIIDAWCGMCYDTATDTWWLALQGGHADYAGNEPYNVGVNVASPTWHMLRKPSGAIGNLLTIDDGQEATGVYSDGRPRSIHSYNKPVFIPGVGPAIAVQGGTSPSGQSGTSKLILVDPVTGEGTLKASNPYVGGDNGASCYDPSRNAVWWRGNSTGGFAKYDVASDAWSAVGIMEVESARGMCWLPGDDCILAIGDGFTGQIRVFDCATGTHYAPALSGTPTVGLNFANGCQPVWVPSMNAAALWNNSSDTATVTLFHKPADPRTGTWTVSSMTFAGMTPSVAAANGTFGRFAYSVNLHGFLLINATNQPIYFFALD